jgi:hypothetical protein
MDLETKILEQDDEGGCIFPVIDPVTGRRSHLCGAKTLYSPDGSKRAFCVEHGKNVRQYALQKKHERKRGDRQADSFFKVGRAQFN